MSALWTTAVYHVWEVNVAVMVTQTVQTMKMRRTVVSKIHHSKKLAVGVLHTYPFARVLRMYPLVQEVLWFLPFHAACYTSRDLPRELHK